MARVFIFSAAALGFFGVALGAFAAHGLKGQLSVAHLAVFQTATQYQMLHALALLAVGVLALRQPSRRLLMAGGFFIAGVVLFSGSLYALTLLNIPALGMITPLGGVLMLSGWLALAWAALRLQPEAR